MPILKVPYYTQPTGNTCQSTCLRMMAEYLDEYLGRPYKSRVITDIQKTLKDYGFPNGYLSPFAWKKWLESEFGADAKFDFRGWAVPNKLGLSDPKKILAVASESIRAQLPIMISVSHSQTQGHIILMNGYVTGKNPANTSTTDYLNTKYICHDPYGERNGLWSSKRFQGKSIASGGESGPGKFVEYSFDDIRRMRAGVWGIGTFNYLMCTEISGGSSE